MIELKDISFLKPVDYNPRDVDDKRLKLIEESAENVLRLIARIAEVKDVKKMRYIELGSM